MKKLFNREIRQEIWYTIRTNKRRTLVTSLGVFAGMFFFTLLTGLGTGIENSINDNLESGASEMQMIMGSRTTIPYKGYKANRFITTNYGDYLDVKRKATTLKHVESTSSFAKGDSNWGKTTVVAKGKSREMNVNGISEGYFPNISRLTMVEGRYFHPSEIADGENLCVIGEEYVKEFFGSNDEALGQYIKLNGLAYRIIGIITTYSDAMTMGFNPKWTILVPLVNATQNDLDSFCMITFVRKEGVTLEEASGEVRAILSKRHNVSPEDTKAFTDINMQMVTQIFEMFGNVIGVLVWVIGLGTLFSGVISVSNVLLITIRERQREIGVRRAIGAKPSDIRLQFFMEAILIITLAGAAGMFLALLVTLGIGYVAEVTPMGAFIQRPYPGPGMLLLSIIIMLISGVLAGLLPVYKALQIKAIDAIRDE